MKNTILSIFSGMMLGTLLVIGVFTVLYFQSSDSVVLAQSMPGEKRENNNLSEFALNITADIKVGVQETFVIIDDMREDAVAKEEAKQEELARKAEEARLAEEARIAALPYLIRVNRLANCVTIYSKDSSGQYTIPIKAMVCSVGLDDGTPLENGQITDKYDWRLLFGNVYGQYAVRFNGHIMFHSVPYMATTKDSLKEGQYNLLGQPASQGCIRLSVIDAKWIYDNCDRGTKVEVYDSADPGPLGKPVSIQIDPNSIYKGWDPTDPDPANPWNMAV